MDNVVSHVEMVHRMGFANPNHRRQTEGQHAQDQIQKPEPVTLPLQLVHQVRLETLLRVLCSTESCGVACKGKI